MKNLKKILPLILFILIYPVRDVHAQDTSFLSIINETDSTSVDSTENINSTSDNEILGSDRNFSLLL